MPLRPSLPSPSPPARRRRPQAALGRGAHHPPRRGPESLGAAAGHRAGCTRLPGVAAGLPLVSPCPWPIWPPGCLCSDLVSLGQWPPQPPSPPQEDVTALQSCRLRLQRKSLTQGRQKHVAFYSPGSVLRVRERRMDHFCAHCLRRDRYSNLERHTVQSITGGAWLGGGPAAGMRGGLSSPGGGVTLIIKDAPWGPCTEVPGGHCTLSSEEDGKCTEAGRSRGPVPRDLGPGELLHRCGP